MSHTWLHQPNTTVVGLETLMLNIVSNVGSHILENCRINLSSIIKKLGGGEIRKHVRLMFWKKKSPQTEIGTTLYSCRDIAVPGMASACDADVSMNIKLGNIYVFMSCASSSDANNLVEYLIEERLCDSQYYDGVMVGHPYTMLAFVTMQPLSVVLS